VRTLSVACSIDFLIAAGLLGTGGPLLCERGSTMGWSVPGGGAAYDSGCRDGPLHHGPVSESAKPGGICGDLCRDPDARKKIYSRPSMARVYGMGASPHGGFRLFLCC